MSHIAADEQAYPMRSRKSLSQAFIWPVWFNNELKVK